MSDKGKTFWKSILGTVPQWIGAAAIVIGAVTALAKGVVTEDELEARLRDYTTTSDHRDAVQTLAKADAEIIAQANVDRALAQQDRIQRDRYRQEAAGRELRITEKLERLAERMTRSWRSQ